jgi:PBSX family phage terminase large subunit
MRVARVSEPRRKYANHGAARKVWYSQELVVVNDGPTGTGKTRNWSEKVLFECLRTPGTRALFLRKVKAHLAQSVLVDFEAEVIAGLPVNKLGGSIERRIGYELPNGSYIHCGGLDDPMRVMSTQWDMAVLFEATEFHESDVEMVLGRLRSFRMPYQQLGIDCNPGPPGHWIKRWFETGKAVRFASRLQDNPKWFDPAKGEWTEAGNRYRKTLEMAYTGNRRERLLLGQWAAAEGMVYDQWDSGKHVIDGVDHAVFKRWVVGVDWGFTNPGVLGLWGIDGDGRMVLVREVYRSGETIAWWVEQAKRLAREFPVEAFVCDPAGPAQIEDFRRADLNAVAADNDVRKGIDVVNQRLRVVGDGRPRLTVLRDCLTDRDPALEETKRPCGFLEEIEGYTWKRSAEGKAVKEEPEKVGDHSMDQARYACMYVDNGVPFSVSVIHHGSHVAPKMTAQELSDSLAKANDERWRRFVTGQPAAPGTASFARVPQASDPSPWGRPGSRHF